jgi:GNAT superfamily N-acetyltransferase
MNPCVYRELEHHEAGLIGAIDRSENIDAVYRGNDGVLRLEETRQESVQTWRGAELAAYTCRLRALIERGGRALGAWQGELLVGVGALDVSGVGGDREMMRLDMLYVSAAHRGRGIGRRLMELVADRARSLGATQLYISATPTRRTVESYLRFGALPLERPDPELLSQEPEDIHLCLRLY